MNSEDKNREILEMQQRRARNNACGNYIDSLRALTPTSEEARRRLVDLAKIPYPASLDKIETYMHRPFK